ncbi:MAG: hypothetical protein QOE14_316, partial [Humisphaera sp.]|nr:hypothetical protein [Humisphaera sp.]
ALAHEQYRDGAGFAHRMWRESPTLAAVREMVPPDKWVYTNAPGAMYLLTGRASIVTIPSKFSASSMRENPKYPGQFSRMRDDLQSGRAVLVYLRRYARSRAYYPKEPELRQGLDLHLIARRSDGAVYDYVPPTTTAASQPATTQP